MDGGGGVGVWLVKSESMLGQGSGDWLLVSGYWLGFGYGVWGVELRVYGYWVLGSGCWVICV